MDIRREQMLGMMDVAMLEPITTEVQVRALAGAALEEGYGYLCVHSLHVRACREALAGGRPRIVACVGFPMGIIRTEVKAAEAAGAVADGAHEIDMVLNLGAFLGGDRAFAERDIREVIRAAGGAPVKVIIEAPCLTRDQKVAASLLVRDAGAAFVKTCTGFCADPLALYEDVRLIRQTVGPAMGVKAAGRMRNYHRFVSMVEAGATRVGLSLSGARETVRGWVQAHA